LLKEISATSPTRERAARAREDFYFGHYIIERTSVHENFIEFRSPCNKILFDRAQNELSYFITWAIFTAALLRIAIVN
jgi:hypothetical protein